MAFVPGYEYDIFVSYADANDALLEGAKSGWVTNFIRELKIGLAQEGLAADSLAIWSKHGASGNQPLSAQILKNAQSSATLLLIFSRAYLKSPWCLEEQQGFLAAVQERVRAGSRVFLVEIDTSAKPADFKGLPGYRFFSRDPATGRARTLGWAGFREEERLDYYDMLASLCQDLNQELQSLKQAPDTAQEEAAPESAAVRPAALLAESSGDLFFLREEVKRHLTQAGFIVLPQSDYPRDPAAFQEAIRRDLAQSRIFVQLLSGLPFLKPLDLPQGPVRCQYELAQQAGIEIMQWRDQGLDLKGIHDPQQRDFLNKETVYAVGIQEFKTEIVKKLRPAPKTIATVPVQNAPMVLVPRHEDDSDLAHTLCGILKKKFCLRYSTPDLPLSRERLAKKMRRCDGLLMIYGKADVDWLEDQWYEIQDVLPERERPLAVFGIYDGPPEEKPELPFGGPGMKVLHCRDCLKEDILAEFVDALQTGGVS